MSGGTAHADRGADDAPRRSQPGARRAPVAAPRLIAPATDEHGLRRDLAMIADWIPPRSHVLDLGCGDGELLDHLQRAKDCTGYGVEIDTAAVLACAKRGVDVIQQDIEAGLDVFAASRFDVVVLSMAIQATHQTERVLREMSRLGTQGIVSFPNFGHWRHAWSLVRGRMPVSREMPYAWFDTPNLHLSTPADFDDLLARLSLAVERRAYLADMRPVTVLPGLRSTQAIYAFRRTDA